MKRPPCSLNPTTVDVPGMKLSEINVPEGPLADGVASAGIPVGGGEPQSGPFARPRLELIALIHPVGADYQTPMLEFELTERRF